MEASRPGALGLEGRGVEGAKERGGRVEDPLEALELSSLAITEGRRRRMVSPMDVEEAAVPGEDAEGVPPCSNSACDIMRYCGPVP